VLKSKLKLFVGLLGQIPEGEMSENHKLEFVVANNSEEAKAKILKKWKVDHVHLDGLKEINEVDGHEVLIKN